MGSTEAKIKDKHASRLAIGREASEEPSPTVEPRPLPLAPTELNPWVVVLRGIWLTLSALVGAGLLIAWLIPSPWLYDASSALSWPHHGHRCALCGMTHAFEALFHADPVTASSFNDHSLLLFSSLLLNETLAARPLVRLTRSLFTHGKRHR